MNIDPNIIKSFTQETETSLTLAKSFWKSTGLSQDAKIVLAPHSVRFAECCSLAVNKYCAVIGIAEPNKPKNVYAHRILELADHSKFDETLELIRQLLKSLKCTATYKFHIEGIFGPDNQRSITTILVGVWKFVVQFENSLRENADLAKGKLLEFFRENEQLAKITDSEISAVFNGSKTYAYLNVFNNDIFSCDDGPQTKEVEANIEHLSERFTLFFIRTNFSGPEMPPKPYFRTSHLKDLADSIANIIPPEAVFPRNWSECTAFGHFLTNLSKTRLQSLHKKAANADPGVFVESEVELLYQIVLNNLHDKHHRLVYGGYVLPTGIVAWSQKGAFTESDGFIYNEIARRFLELNKRRITTLHIESYQPASEPHVLNMSEAPAPEMTSATIVLNYDAAYGHASSSVDQ